MSKRLERRPDGLRHTLQEGDVQIVSALQRHGVLNKWQLSKLCPYFTNEASLKNRLKVLYDNPIWPYGWLIDRPHSQKRNDKFRSTFLYYQKTKDGDELLKAKGLYQEHAVKPAPPLTHQIFSSTLSFSLEHGAPEGVTFIPQYDTNKNGVEDAMEIEIEGKLSRLVWDGHVALEYKDQRMYLFLEADRATEAVESNKPRKNTKTNMRQYHIAIGKGKHKSHFDVQSDAILLYATILHGRLENALKLADHAPYILGTALPDCASLETMPSYIPVYDILWERAGLPACRIMDFFTDS